MFETLVTCALGGALVAGIRETPRPPRPDQLSESAKPDLTSPLEVASEEPPSLQAEKATEGPNVPVVATTGTTEDTWDTAWRTVMQLLLSAAIGFVLGGMTAGFLERMGAENIEFMSITANLLIAFWTALVWLLLSRRERRRKDA